MTTERKCKTCELWDIAALYKVTKRITRNHAARCMWQPSPVPDSWIKGSIVVKHATGPESGKSCPCWKERT